MNIQNIPKNSILASILNDGSFIGNSRTSRRVPISYTFDEAMNIWPLFTRIINVPSEIIFHILYCYEIKHILLLRLISRGFCDLISMAALNCRHSPLASKAMISFQYCQLLRPVLYPLVQERFDFSKENTEVQIIIDHSDLLLAEALDTILESDLKVVLKIDNLDAWTEAFIQFNILNPFDALSQPLKKIEKDNIEINATISIHDLQSPIMRFVSEEKIKITLLIHNIDELSNAINMFNHCLIIV